MHSLFSENSCYVYLDIRNPFYEGNVALKRKITIGSDPNFHLPRLSLFANICQDKSLESNDKHRNSQVILIRSSKTLCGMRSCHHHCRSHLHEMRWYIAMLYASLIKVNDWIGIELLPINQPLTNPNVNFYGIHASSSDPTHLWARVWLSVCLQIPNDKEQR